MNKNLSALSLCLMLAALLGCSAHDQEKTRENVDKVGAKVKEDAKELSHNVDKAVGTDTTSASEKLADGKAKLSQATLVAQVKAALASDAGMATITGIDVDARGSVVTLRGHVSTQAQKDAADHAAAKVDGVTRVENELNVDGK